MEESDQTEVGTYSQDFDVFGPNNFFPLHCYTTDKSKKYESPVIGYIDNGNEITMDIVQQLTNVFADQAYITQSLTDIDDVLAEYEDLFNPFKLLGLIDDEKIAENEE